MIGTMQYVQCCSVFVSILPRGQRKWSTKERRNGSAYTPCAQLLPPLSLCHYLACLVARHCEPVRLWWRSCCQSCMDHTKCSAIPFRDSKIFRYEEKAWPACACGYFSTMLGGCWNLEGNHAPLFPLFGTVLYEHAMGVTTFICFSAASVCCVYLFWET